jgi:ribonuclease PH
VIPVLIAIIEALVDGTLIVAVTAALMALLAAVSLLGAFACVTMAITTLIKAIFGISQKVMRRTYINNDGQKVIEEVPYDPAMNFVNAAVRTTKELTYDRERQG